MFSQVRKNLFHWSGQGYYFGAIYKIRKNRVYKIGNAFHNFIFTYKCKWKLYLIKLILIFIFHIDLNIITFGRHRNLKVWNLWLNVQNFAYPICPGESNNSIISCSIDGCGYLRPSESRGRSIYDSATLAPAVFPHVPVRQESATYHTVLGKYF